MSTFQPRPGQQEVLRFSGGWMGVTAVPGAGKTRTLAELAARLVARVDDDQEVLVVTLVNSAVDNFKSRINQAVRAGGLLPNFGYRVRTLHGLAHDIVRERPALVGLADDFGIIDEREADRIREDAVATWLRSHPDAADRYLSPGVEGQQAEWVKSDPWPRVARNIAAAFIRRAKDLGLTPEVLSERLKLLAEAAALEGRQGELGLARMGTEIYADYQRSLAYRGAVDFDDLIRLALVTLQLDADYLARLQQRWPYILEDEAQDSSRTQQEILKSLVGSEGHWVRVGDTNQAIYETFTTADPELLRRFLRRSRVRAVQMEQSGRSQQAIIDLANRLVDWACAEHPLAFAQERAFFWQHIAPTAPGDPQPNPPTDLAAVRLVIREQTPEQELQRVVEWVQRWHKAQEARPAEERETCAVLDPRTDRAVRLAALLRERRVPVVELLRSTSSTRQAAGVLGNVLRCLADPVSQRKLATAFRVWRRQDRDDAEAKVLLESVADRIHRCQHLEAYLWPRADQDWLADLAPELETEELGLLTDFRQVARRWHRAAGLPIDQLILTLVSDLFQEPAELALAHKFAVALRDVATSHPAYRLTELVEELAVIARNERRFLGFSSADSGFKPRPGEVTVATMHKSKGLEWDRVYLMSVNNYDFPSGLAHDTYIAERWFVRDNLNLVAEALAQVEALAALDPPPADPVDVDLLSLLPPEGRATQEARWEYIAERLRLLYVGITRARKALTITWNTGRGPRAKLQPAVALVALYEWWRARLEAEGVEGP